MTKRSANIDLSKMRKGTAVKRSLIATTISMILAGCSSSETATVYTTLEECEAANPDNHQMCIDAYQKAKVEAERTAPRFRTFNDCAAEFGRDQCVSHQNHNGGGGWFMPMMAGYMIANALNGHSGYVPQPVYTSHRRGSSVYGGWYGADGTSYGSTRSRTARVSTNSFKPKPRVTRTISRGGFGSIASAKASFGRGGWGG